MTARNKALIAGSVIVTTICGSIMLFLRFVRADNIDSLIDQCRNEGYKAQQCLNDLVVRIAKEKGLDAGFDALQSVYFADSEFASSCHGATHELGSLAFDVYERGSELKLNDKTSYCGFGFFHGFIEILLQSGGNLAEARTFCEETVSSLSGSLAGVASSCYHGIGHGFIDGTDPEAWGNELKFIQRGLMLCEDLTADPEYRERCASGVFNALAIEYDNPKYALRPNPRDPYRACRAQTNEWAKDACYDQMNGYISRSYPVFSEALKIAEDSSERSFRATAIGAVAGYRPQMSLAGTRDVGEDVRDCMGLEREWRSVCAKSYAVGLIEFGKPKQEYIIATDACITVRDLASPCLEGVADATRLRLDPSLHPIVCAYIQDRAGDTQGGLCRTTMGI